MKSKKCGIVKSSLVHDGSIASSEELMVRGMLNYLGGSLFVHAKGVLDLVSTVKEVSILNILLKLKTWESYMELLAPP